MNAFRFPPGFNFTYGGVVEKAEHNLAAIRLLKSGQRSLSSEQMLTLARYTGWGDTAVFKAAMNRGLADLLTRDELEGAKTSTLNAHYTALPVVRAIWEALVYAGVGRAPLNALDPSAGIGHFASAAPDPIYDNARWVEIELDPITAEILRQLRPGG